MLKRLITLSAALTLSLPVLAQRDFLKDGQDMTEAFYARKIDVVWANMNGTMRGAIKSPEALLAFRDQAGQQLGKESAIIDEALSRQSALTVYKRSARFERAPGTVIVNWVFEEDGKVAGFSILPQPSEAATSNSYQTKAKLRLPFEEPALVVWGGRRIEQNQHAALAAQRYALDLLMVRGGATHQGKGSSNDQYYCFGKTIVAPAAGKVASAVDGIADNQPGTMNPAQVLGNHVLIDHGQGEYSLLAHLRKGSVKVAANAQIGAGQTVGECGNSGNSSEPHLHYQLQNSAQFGQAESLPAQFNGYVADGKAVARGEPVKGQIVVTAP